jgi:hypothetical protein
MIIRGKIESKLNLNDEFETKQRKIQATDCSSNLAAYLVYPTDQNWAYLLTILLVYDPILLS